MITVENILNSCDALRKERKGEVKILMTKWLDSFIEEHRPWRAIVGSKKRHPIPIYRSFKTFDFSSSSYSLYLFWPNLPESDIIEVLQSLGFVTYNSLSKLCLSVPPVEKGKSLTFAQKKVREINQYYSLYIDQERKEAKEEYQNILNALSEFPSEEISFTKDYILFKNFSYSRKCSKECSHYLNILLAQNGFKSIYADNSTYLGLGLFYRLSSNI